MPTIDLDQITHRLSLQGTGARAVGAKAYLKSDLDFLGVNNGEVALAVRRTVRETGDLGRESILQSSLEAFDSPFFEIRLFGVKLLEHRLKILEPDDIYHVERLIRLSSSWALVDPLAKPIGASLIDRGMPEVGSLLDEWSTDDNFWIRRCSMLVLIPRLQREDDYWGRFVRYADSMIDEKEFFIRKVIGWVLRDVSRVRPEPVAEFVHRHISVISGVTFREAVKYLPEPEQTELKEAYKAR